ncbi:ABC transporter permease [Paenibacillus xylaniclasticus]|uniref:ABC transporter permease n=1 Tax=Paenibacillus xylaniclasticus TaxID=588083 RepID=UPI000FD8E502|nr:MULTISPECIES: ABC transporter permease [Paenibacillus]GFN31182.1 ABC transporter permease [Paenibacillus curdlanolyticus]
MDFVTTLLAAALSAGTPLLFATLGGILSERCGVIFLGTEGVMLMGAVVSIITLSRTGSWQLAIAMAMFAGAAFGVLHGVLCVSLKANQTLSGMGLTLLGTGLSAFLGKPYAGLPVPSGIPRLNIPMLENVPLLGDLLGRQNVLLWASLVLVIVMQAYIFRTGWGLKLRAVGDSPSTADAMGIRVAAVRYGHIAAGAMLMGLAGAYLVLVFSPNWMEGMTAGRGWIAVVLVIFARWNPVRALLGAYLFGAFEALGYRIQTVTAAIPPYFLKMLPYLITVLVLIFIGWYNRNKPSGQPQSLGVSYYREQRV